jgi:hypothetical protein
MQSDFEQIDVENAEYEAGDATGTRVKMRVQTSSEWFRIESLPKPQLEQLGRQSRNSLASKALKWIFLCSAKAIFTAHWIKYRPLFGSSPEVGGRGSSDVSRPGLTSAEFTLYLRPSLSALCSLCSLCLNPITDDGNQTNACSRSHVRHVR